ncbi:MAG: IgGFc-binding protein [Flavobacteriales bacterium]|nr:IgGFc-binding protein [Flavobacteriales bacterium]
MRLQLRTALLSCSLLLLVVGNAQQLIPTRGREFWFGFMQNYSGSTGSHLYVYVSSDANTFGTMRSPLTGWSQDFNVAANSVTQLEVPLSNMHVGSELIDSRSVLIETEDTVAVYALNFETATADAAVIYPTGSLGTSYRVQTYKGLGGLPSELLIVATADDTEVEIVPAAQPLVGRSPEFHSWCSWTRGRVIKCNPGWARKT